jgi:hypothetical protein
MTPRRITTFRIDEDALEAMRQIYERDGILVPEQVRRAIATWIDSKAVKKAERRRASTRKRP